MQSELTVFIIDDNPEFLESVSVLIQSMGMRTRTYLTGNSYLHDFDPQHPGCLIIDVRMPITGGLSLQQTLSKLPLCPPLIILTGHAEIPVALRAIRQGAIDFLQKTCSEGELFDAIQKAFSQDTFNRAAHSRARELADRFARLSPGEHDVLQLILLGDTNKKIAATIDVSQRTVEDRRARIMEKLQVATLPELIRLAIEAGVWKSTTTPNRNSHMI